MPETPQSQPFPYGRLYALGLVCACGVSAWVNWAYFREWQAGGTARPLLLSLAILLGLSGQLLNLRDYARGVISFPASRSYVQLTSGVVALGLLLAYSLT